MLLHFILWMQIVINETSYHRHLLPH